MDSPNAFTMLPPPPKASKNKRKLKRRRSNPIDQTKKCDPQPPSLADPQPRSFAMGEMDRLPSMLSYDADSSAFSFGDNFNNTLNSLDTTMLNLVDNPFRDNSILQSDSPLKESTPLAIATFPPSQSKENLASPKGLSDMYTSRPFICGDLKDTSILSGLHDTFSDKERQNEEQQDHDPKRMDVFQFLTEGRRDGDDDLLEGLGGEQPEARTCLRSTSSGTSELADHRNSAQKQIKRTKRGREKVESSNSSEISTLEKAKENDNDLLAPLAPNGRKFAERKLTKIESKIRKYESKLKVLREKRAAFKSQLNPRIVTNSANSTVSQSVPPMDSNRSKEYKERRESKYEEVNAMEFMRTGSAMLKYGRFGYPHFRQFELSENGQFLVWYSSGKKLDKSRIDLSTVTKLQQGQLTPIFKKHLQPRLASCSFSLIYRDGKSLKSLDVITKNRSAFVLWTKGLLKIIEHQRQCRLRGPNQQPPFPTMLKLKIVKRNAQTIKDRLSKLPEPPKKMVERELKEATERFEKLMKVSQDPKWDNVLSMVPVRKRLVELEADMERNRHLFESKTMNVASHEIWRTSVEMKALKNKIQAIAKAY